MRKTKAEIDVLLKPLPRAKVELIEPMLAKLSNSIPQGPNWLYELKFDGYRMLAIKQGRRVTLFSRRGDVLNSQYPEIAKAFEFLPDSTIVDGEVVAVDEKGQLSFAALQRFRSRTASRYFYAFDLLTLDGKDLRNLSLIERRSLLQQKVFDRNREPVRLWKYSKSLLAARKSRETSGPRKYCRQARGQSLRSGAQRRLDQIQNEQGSGTGDRRL